MIENTHKSRETRLVLRGKEHGVTGAGALSILYLLGKAYHDLVKGKTKEKKTPKSEF